MNQLCSGSEAAALALHAAALLAARPAERRSAGELAAALGVSRDHLAKVLQRLEQAGLLAGTRGPHGGYRLARPPQDVSLAEVLAVIDSPGAKRCPFAVPVCDGRGCGLGGFFRDINRRVATKLARTRLAQVRLKFGGTQ
jgi:Rrf2 family protein